MNGILVASLMGRAGNQTLQWLFAYAFAKKYGMEFQCEEWIGERIFDLPKYARPVSRDFKRVSELDIFDAWRSHSSVNLEYDTERPDPGPCFEFRGYAQTQAAMIYSKREAQSWLKLRPEIEQGCARPRFDRVVGHHRVGDYFGYGYPVVRSDSYFDACMEFGIDPREMVLLSEELTWTERHPDLPNDLSFMPDFLRMMNAKILLRGNSTFSWLAALLGNGLVLSPVIDGLEGGKEHHVKFIAGNHPKFCNLDFVSDLWVNP